MTEHTPIRLIVGLGNPGDSYADTRHNAGFWLVDLLAQRHGGTFRTERKFNAELATLDIEGNEVRLLKPKTWMNRSGQAVQAAAAYLKFAPENILVVHDDLDLPPGTARLKLGGGAGGHNGLKDVIAQLGPGFWRLRLGVGHPGHRAEVVDHVLSRASRDEEVAIRESIEEAVEVVPILLGHGDQPAMHRLHSRRPADGPSDATD